ncbi:hypothetical protein GCM10011504_53410 [Siccirubricoccus deserti]|nr:hypothetical protein GCM10011504_53410 [Siccirubricoccus deserti]
MFLGLVEAELVGYGDCGRFQITCPCCHEAVHKRVLRRPGGRETHYLAHYRESPSEESERCELRVATITPQQVEMARVKARARRRWRCSSLAIGSAWCVVWSLRLHGSP